MAASISHFVTAVTKFSRCSSNRKMSPCFLSLTLDFCHPFSCWASLASRLLSLFLCVSLALYSKSVDMTTNLSLILWKTRIQRQFPLSVFVFIDSLVVSALQDAGGYAISRQNNLELPYFLIEVFYIGMPVVWTDGWCTVTWLPNFLGWIVYHIFLPMVLCSARFAREISAIIFYNYCLNKICLRLTGIFEQSQKDDHAKSHRLCLCPPRERETYKASKSKSASNW